MSEFSKAARVLGRAKSEKKSASSRRNGRLGGRPKKKGTHCISRNKKKDIRIDKEIKRQIGKERLRQS